MGYTRLAPNPTPIPQDFKLLRRCAEVKTKSAFFQEQREEFAIDAVVCVKRILSDSKIPNAVDVVLTVCKSLETVDAVMDETAYVRLVIAAQAIRVNNAIRHDFLFDNRHQSIGLSIIYDNGIDPSVAFQNAEDVETSSVVYSISRRILKHAQKHPSYPPPPPSRLAGLYTGEGKRQLIGTALPSQPRHHLPRT